MQPTVFISYASADLVYAEAVHGRLTAAGFDVWFDKARLRPGYDWHKEVEAGCEASRVVLPVLTPRWKLSEWTKFETYGAEAVIPLVFEGAFVDVATPPLTRLQALSIDLAVANNAAWEQLFAELRALLAVPAPDKAARLADARYAANPYFVGREHDLNQIHEALHQTPTAVLTQGCVRAIAALGGVGKTTLARQYIEKFWRGYPQIFWVDCRLGVASEFARVCDLLMPEARGSTNVDEKARLALQALQSRVDRLLILDNAEDETSIQAWIPKSGHCRTLITSRFAGWSAAVKSLHLDVLEPEPAHRLLVARAGHGEFAQLADAERAACTELAKQLGYLPLALEQAAAYVEQQGRGFSFADYLRLYGEATAALLAAGVLGSTEYPDSVITTWKATLAKLDPASKAILRLCAFFAPTPLPLTVLFGGTQVLLEEAAVVAGSAIAPPAHGEVWVRAQVKQLRDYSMVEGDGTSISIHPLVQTVQRLNLDVASGEHRGTLERALQWVDTAFVGEPQDVRTWPTLEPLGAHALAVLRHADHAAIADPTSRLMSALGVLLHARALHADAEPLFRRALAIDEKSDGPERPIVAIYLNNLAVLLKATNRLADAEPLMRRALAIDERSYGPEHSNVARDLNNLAALLQTINRLADAEPLMQRALAIDEQFYGSEHPAVARDLNNLAALLKATNRLADAEPLLRRALAIDKQFYGAEHPNVARDLSYLAALLKATNRLVDAEPLLRRALAIDEQAYGAEHPEVASSLGNLALLLQATNHLSDAEPLLRRALAIDEQFYGAEHPKVANGLNNLAQLLAATNRLADVEPMMRRALTIDERSYGPEHPHVARDLNNLAQVLYATHRLADAEPLMRRALAIDEQSYGPEHPDVARDLNNLAQLLQATDRVVDAEPLMRRALAIDERSFGAEHPGVARDLNNLAGLLQATARLAEAEPLMRRALAIDEQSLGAEHPDVATDLNNLAGLLQATARLAEAEPLMRRALAIDEQSYGPEHPDVARDLNNLAQLLEATDRIAEAEPLMARGVRIFEKALGTNHPNVAAALNSLAALLRATKRLAEAEPLMRRALAIDEQSHGSEHPDVARDLNNLAQLLEVTNRPAEAETLMRRGLAIDEKFYGPEHPYVARDLNSLAVLLTAADRLAEAEPPMRRASEILLKVTHATGRLHPHTLAACRNYAQLLLARGMSDADVGQRLDELLHQHG